jgi:hypothetical protein
MLCRAWLATGVVKKAIENNTLKSIYRATNQAVGAGGDPRAAIRFEWCQARHVN